MAGHTLIMLASLWQWLAVWPPEVAVMVIGFLPLVEIRGAVPVGLTVYGLSAVASIWWAFLGNLTAAVLLLNALPWLAVLGQKSRLMTRLLDHIFHYTKKRWLTKHERFGAWMLLIFVAVPLPLTGAWTGSVAAWLFGIPTRRALPLIAAGILLSGCAVYFLTFSGVSLWTLLAP